MQKRAHSDGFLGEISKAEMILFNGSEKSLMIEEVLEKIKSALCKTENISQELEVGRRELSDASCSCQKNTVCFALIEYHTLL